MKVCDVKELINLYGTNATLGDVLTQIQKGRIYKCPKCNGRGYETVEYNKYPSGLPDSGWVYDPGFKDVECDLCNGEGYTSHEYKPKMVQDGWE